MGRFGAIGNKITTENKEAVSIQKFETVFFIRLNLQESLSILKKDKIALKRQFSFLSCVLKPLIRTPTLFFGFLLMKIV